ANSSDGTQDRMPGVGPPPAAGRPMIAASGRTAQGRPPTPGAIAARITATRHRAIRRRRADGRLDIVTTLRRWHAAGQVRNAVCQDHGGTAGGDSLDILDDFVEVLTRSGDGWALTSPR